MRFGVRLLAVAMALAACGTSANTTDQGTIDICYSIIGFAQPTTKALGPVGGWYSVAHAAATVAKDRAVLAAAAEVARATDPRIQQSGFSDAQIAVYRDAARKMDAACKASKAYESRPNRLYS